jgi:hypothetical protein
MLALVSAGCDFQYPPAIQSASCVPGGNWFTLLRELGDLKIEDVRALKDRTDKTRVPEKKRLSADELIPYETNLAIDAEVQEYLSKRGITMDTARAWRLGTKLDKGRKALLIPYIVDGVTSSVRRVQTQ